MSKAFASQADLADKKITFEQLSKHCWAYTAEGDPNSGVIIGDKFIMVSDATATPAMARDLIARIRDVQADKDRRMRADGMPRVATVLLVLMAMAFEYGAKLVRFRLYERLINEVDGKLARLVFKKFLSVRLDQLPRSVGGLAEQMRGYETVRSFFGVHKIVVTPNGQYHVLMHGTTIHGASAVLVRPGSSTPIVTFRRRVLPVPGNVSARSASRRRGCSSSTTTRWRPWPRRWP